jgi:lysophospholipid hydrolase
MSMTPRQDGSEESWYRPGRLGSVTPGLTRQDTAAWSSSISTRRAKRAKEERIPSDGRAGDDNFNLRDAVMTSIAQSIGLLQPAGTTGGPLSSISVPNTPSVQAQRQNGSSRSPFGSLSMIELLHVAQHSSPLAVGDEESSMNGTTPESVMDGKNANIVEEIGNEVEILYFSAGTTLVKAGETQAGELWCVTRPRMRLKATVNRSLLCHRWILGCE